MGNSSPVQQSFDVLPSNAILILSGVFFLALQFLVLSALLPDPSTHPLLFWFCNNSAFFLALAAFSGNMQLMKGISYVGLITQLLWITDFFAHIVGTSVSHTADYIFVEGLTFANDVSVLVHISIPVLALFLTAHIRPRIESLYYSLVYVLTLYVATIAGTLPIDDINCVFNACGGWSSTYHLYAWPLYIGILILGSYAIHVYLFHFLDARNDRTTR